MSSYEKDENTSISVLEGKDLHKKTSQQFQKLSKFLSRAIDTSRFHFIFLQSSDISFRNLAR